MYDIWKERARRYWYLPCTAIFVGATAIAAYLMISFVRQEHSHYDVLGCQISDCVILRVVTCSYFNRNYACYDGRFNYSATIDNRTYIDSYSFRRTQSNNYKTYLDCIGNKTIRCTYDDRDILGTFGLG